MAIRKLVFSVLGTAILALAAPAQEVNLLALGEGTLPVVEPSTYASWPAIRLLDDDAGSGWACEKGKAGAFVFVPPDHR